MLGTLPAQSVACQPLNVFANTLKKGNNNFTMNLAERLKAAREAAGYTQKELAKKVGIAQQTINKIEDKIILRPRKLSELESVLGLSPGYLMYGEDGDRKISSLPQPMIARCPILSWEDAASWPRNRQEITKDSHMQGLAQKIILGSNCYALKIDNDAMTDVSRKQSFKEDSYIIVDPDAEYKSGSLVVATDNSNSSIFRRYVKEGNKEYLFAYNNNYDAIKIEGDLKICGVVIANLDVLV